MTASDPRPIQQKIGSTTLQLFFHATAALLIVSVGSTIVIALAENVLSAMPNNDFAAECLVFVIGIGAGFFVNRAAFTRVACWVWLPGLIWLAFGLWDSVRHYDPRWSQGCSATEYVINSFFVLDSSRCSGAEGPTLSGLFFTLPAYSSVAYSVGAWIALRVGRRRRNTSASLHSS